MSVDLGTYDGYRESGLSWLGEIPAHWDVRRIKTLFWEKDKRSGDGSGILLSMTRARGILPQSEASARIATVDDLSNYKLCRPGDLVMNRMQAWSGMFALSTYSGLVSPDYSVFETVGSVTPKYFEYLFKTPLMINQFAQRSKGVGSGFNRLYSPEFGAIAVVNPPEAEQGAIVRFLNQADRRINRLIRNKRRLIALLTEQKQAIIHRAVTRGLDPDVPRKPSGVDWLGAVPAHWTVAALRMRYSIELGKMLDSKRITGQYLVPYLRNIDVQWNRVNTDNLPTMDIEPREYDRYTVREGDLLVCEGGEVGRSAFWKGDLKVCGFQKALHRVRALQPEQDLPKFLYYLMFATSRLGVFQAGGSENTIAHLTGEKFRAHRFPFPPKEEQQEIALHLDGVSHDIEQAIIRARREIDLIREYRTRLIADVVTGKVDVRHLAADLPDEIDEDDTALAVADDLLADEDDSEEKDEIDSLDVEDGDAAD